jgi:hypothetical protein
MLKRYYSAQEASQFLSSERQEEVSVRDVIETAARGQLRLCFWVDDVLSLYQEEAFDDPIPLSLKYQLRGYARIPQRLITPCATEFRFDGITEIVENLLYADVDDINSHLEEGVIYCGLMALWSGEHVPFAIDLSEALIPAADLLALTTKTSVAERPVGIRERTTLLTVIGALASAAKLDLSKTSKSAQAIEAMTAKLGVRIAARTIEEHLKRIPEALERRAKS